jgi:hypothetical protein
MSFFMDLLLGASEGLIDLPVSRYSTLRSLLLYSKFALFFFQRGAV